ncbi:membrane protein insertion efficiency factor YidD [Ancylomarina euxinus]|uniref:Membrane protein insertion efficiency factor YidD n=1 Tax=Ancylomarina euxinus TaxID=2283627 RepID=A0A425Y5I7_9BACT|nr:membrane protein insertion efficiency factor YidD [Ancylomarina euxinus]MCZ4694210.1 membrane protein insertion efficiency factor YidD [Ancylomarina euxinus]MUP14459.1 membrane protein insertion efficiency factor YidD [Ancylomarina euxinus]RRG23762.1 membrane protein insertion efficiency factor YidD [Ancylomarina euxinus]
MQKLINQIYKLTFTFSFILCLCILTQAQSKESSNIQLILKTKTNTLNTKKPSREYIYKNEKSWLKKYNPISLGFGSLLYLYQNVLSQQFSADCLYHPTCSDFSKDAIREYGLVKGIFLSSDRICRCNRIAATSINYFKFDQKSHHAHDSVSYYRIKPIINLESK